MMRKQRRLLFLIVVIPLLAMSAGSLAFLIGFGKTTIGSLPAVLEEAARERIRGKVTIGKIERISPSGVSLTKVVITDETSKKPIAEIPKMRVSLSYPGMILRRTEGVSAIRDIRIENPRLYLERMPDGRWNIANIVKPAPPGRRARLLAKVHVKSGTVFITDRMTPTPETNDLRRINALLDLSENPVLRYRLSGNGPTTRLRGFAAEGKYNLADGSIDAGLNVVGADAAYWTRYPKRLGLDIMSGRADGTFHLRRRDGKESLRYAGAIHVRGTSVRLRQITRPIKDIEGRLDMRRDLVVMALNGKLGSSPIRLSGSVVDFSSPRLALRVTSDGTNWSEISRLAGASDRLRGVQLPQTGKCDLLFFGPPASPGIDFAISVPWVRYNGVNARALTVRGGYSDGKAVIRDANAEVYGGRVRIRGQIEGSEALFDGTISDVRLGNVPELRKRGLSATCFGNADVSWAKGRTTLRYRGTLVEARLGRLDLEDTELGVIYRDGVIHVEELSSRTLGGVIAASGQVSTDGQLDLDVAGADINLAAVKEMYWDQPTVGRGQFAGKITGSVESPVFDGELDAHRVMIAGIGIERITASLSASRKEVKLRRLTVYDFPGTVTATGRITNPTAKSPLLDVSVVANSIGFDRIAETLGIGSVGGGVLSGELLVTGTARSPRAEGRLRAKGLFWRGMDIDALDAELDYWNDVIRIKDAQVKAGDSALSAKGRIDRGGILDLRLRSDGFDLARLSRAFQPYVNASGRAVIDASLTGRMSQPEARLRLMSENLTINTQSFEKFNLEAELRESTATVSELGLTDGDASYRISDLKIGTAKGDTAFDLSVSNGQIGKMIGVLEACPAVRQSGNDGTCSVIRRLLATLPRPLSGSLDATVGGSIRSVDGHAVPDLKASLEARDLHFGTNSIRTVRARGEWKDGVAKLESFDALDEDTNVTAQGVYGPGDTMSVQVDAHSLSLESLRQWVRLPDNISGLADVTIVAEGSAKEPLMEASVEIVEPKIGKVKFDRLSSRLSANVDRLSNSKEAGRLEVRYATLVLGNHTFRTAGYVPVDWKNLTIPEDGELALRSELDRGDLQFFSAITGVRLQTSPTGDFRGVATLGGTIKSPKLTGGIVWHGGQVQFPRLETRFDDVEADIVFDEDKLLLRKMTARSAQGGNVEVSGHVAFPDLKPRLNMAVKASNLRLTGRNVSNTYGEDVTATFQSDLRVTGDWQSPLVSGSVSIPEGSIELAGKGVRNGFTGPRTINPTFDVTASLGRGVTFESARLNTPLFGTIALKGTLNKPVLDGSLDISGGNIIFPMRALRILPGSTVEIITGPGQQIVTRIDLTAETRVTTISPLGTRSRYEVTMVAQGPLDNLKPTFTSSPPGLTEDRIVALLTGQRQLEQILARDTGKDIGKELSGLFSTAMMPTVFKPIEQAFESALGFEEFALEMGYREPLQLTIGDRLFDGLYLDYTAVLGARPDYADSRYEMKLSYRFKRGVEVGVSTDENRTFSLGVEGKLRF